MPTTVKSTERGRGPKVASTVVRSTLRDTTPPSLINLQNAVRAASWEVNAKVLDIVALVCTTDQQWRVARSQLLTLFNNEDKTQKLILGQFELSMNGAKETEKNGNG